MAYTSTVWVGLLNGCLFPDGPHTRMFVVIVQCFWGRWTNNGRLATRMLQSALTPPPTPFNYRATWSRGINQRGFHHPIPKTKFRRRTRYLPCRQSPACLFYPPKHSHPASTCPFPSSIEHGLSRDLSSPIHKLLCRYIGNRNGFLIQWTQTHHGGF
jgi:hypothetical protein